MMATPREPFEPIVVENKGPFCVHTHYIVKVATGRVYLETYPTPREIELSEPAIDGIIDAVARARDYKRGMR